jgi:sugar lactone lactonase YvrE
MEIFATGLGLGESPRWHDGRVWVCDWTAGEVLSFGADGQRRVELGMTGLPFSIDWLPEGRALLTCTTGVVTADGAPYGATGQGWNEIVVDPRGNAFANAAGFDLMGGEQPRPGFVWVIRPDGSAREVAGEVMFPNGMAVTPDGSTLIVAESYACRLTAFDIAEDGGLSGRRLWADLGEHAPDGICLDADGAVWYASVPGRCCVRVAEGSKVLERVDADRGCFACMLGGDDGCTLYIVATEWSGVEGVGGRTGQVLTHRAPSPHAGHP